VRVVCYEEGKSKLNGDNLTDLLLFCLTCKRLRTKRDGACHCSVACLSAVWHRTRGFCQQIGNWKQGWTRASRKQRNVEGVREGIGQPHLKTMVFPQQHEKDQNGTTAAITIAAPSKPTPGARLDGQLHVLLTLTSGTRLGAGTRFSLPVFLRGLTVEHPLGVALWKIQVKWYVNLRCDRISITCTAFGSPRVQIALFMR
jgi:hypothetical protein